ncbi:YHS domain-containing protein [Haloferula sargassicola]|uniref:TRASH domain-containing protein n=1 Tax=Haloferula sargassicola TaxID=490096 RepID=A0ABP9UR14_9BACT
MKITILITSLAFAFTSCSKQETATAEPPAESATAVDTAGAKPYPLEVCLVSGEKLGEMGEPHVIVYEGQTIKFCCEHCEPKFRKDPEKYLSKLEQP